MLLRGLSNTILGSVTTATTCLGANTLISYFTYRKQGLSDARLELTLSMQINSEMVLALSILIACVIGHVMSWRHVILLDWHRVLAVSFISVIIQVIVQMPWIFFGTIESDWTRLAYIVGLPLTTLVTTAVGVRFINRVFWL